MCPLMFNLKLMMTKSNLAYVHVVSQEQQLSWQLRFMMCKYNFRL